jgi:hypothetical protein
MEGLLIAVTFALNIGILCSTWWYTRKRQLANDWVSGTECRTRVGLRASIRSAISLPSWKLPVKAIHSLDALVPSSLGRFEVTGEIDCQSTAPGVRWFTGLDKQLERAIWIAYLTDPATPFDELQSHKPKSVRLRFIEEGSTLDCRWFAFVAPDSVPVMECAKQGIQFPWPITRSILGEVAELSSTTSVATNAPVSDSQIQSDNFKGLDANQLWVDSAGRLNQIDFRCSKDEHVSIVPLVSKLGLPPRHRLRKTLRANNSSNTLLPIEAIPPLRALHLLEQIGSNARSPSSAELKQMLEKLDKQSHELTPSLRFVSAAASLGLMSPMMFFAIVMLVVPSVILIVDGLYKEIRKLKSLAVYTEQPELFPDTWKFATDEEKSRWVDSNSRKEIQVALELQTDRMKSALNRVGSLERMILTSIPAVNLDSPPVYGSKRTSSTKIQEVMKEDDESSGETNEKIKISAGPMNVVEVNFGQEEMDSELVQSILGSVERSKQLPTGNEKVPDFMIVGIGMAVCVLWTTFTFGGITKHFTGICYMRRDGRNLGILRSFCRAVLLYLPLLLVVYLISYCNALGYEYLWWGTLLKRVFLVLPLAYLVTTLIWYRRTPLDILSGTVAVPR